VEIPSTFGPKGSDRQGQSPPRDLVDFAAGYEREVVTTSRIETVLQFPIGEYELPPNTTPKRSNAGLRPGAIHSHSWLLRWTDLTTCNTRCLLREGLGDA
jgi:hypothetical protein